MLKSNHVLFVSICCYLMMCGVSRSQVKFQHRILTQEKGKCLVGDIDSDGKNDIIFRGGDQVNRLSWLRYPDMKEQVIAKGDFSGDRFDVDDLDDDGDLDIITSQKGQGAGLLVYWYENPQNNARSKRNATWQERFIGDQGQDIDDPRNIKDLLVADVNNDGKKDVVARSHHYTRIYFQKSHDWQTKTVYHPKKEGMALGDLDKDGDVDIVLNGFWLETPADAETGEYVQHKIDEKWYKQNTGKWQDNCCYVGVADIDKDGILDVVFSHSEKIGYPLSWYSVTELSKVKNGPWREHEIAARFDWCETIDIGDVDGDGNLDVLAAKFLRQDPQNYNNNPPYPVVVYYNVNGNGLMWRTQELAQTGVYAGVFGDVGSDGDLDVLGPRSYWTGPNEIWESQLSDKKLALDKWHYIQVDDRRGNYVVPGGQGWWRWFGLDMADVTGDGYADIASGKYFYRNPGGDMTRRWHRVHFPIEVDAMMMVDVDGDGYGDVIGLAQPNIYWLEARDSQGDAWSARQIGTLPGGDHGNTQLYAKAQIVPGGRPELLFGSTDGMYYFEIPDHPEEGNWPKTRICPDYAGYAAGDIDGDGFLDIAGSAINPDAADSLVAGTRNVKWWGSLMCWWKNPGDGSSDWQRYAFGTATHADRFAIADINGDGRLDIINSEERYPGHVANADLYWFEQPADPTKQNWRRHHVIRQQSMNNLDVTDMDRDGDMDIVTCEHNMPYRGKPAPGNEKLQIWENDGKGNFTERIIDREKESHLGSQAFDMDGDGDLDIVSIAWRDFQYLHLWRNDAIKQDESAVATVKKAPFVKQYGKYRLPIEVSSNGYARHDRAVEININFTEMLARLNSQNTLATGSLRLVEVDGNGRIVDASVPFQFETKEDYDAASRAVATLVFILQGTTPAYSSRHYHLYFSDGDNVIARPAFETQIKVEEWQEFQGMDALKIITPKTTYVYHKHGGGFASLIDADGNDWVGYNPDADCFKGPCRGIPNIAPPGFHPDGERREVPRKTTTIISQGPVKVQLQTETEDERWGCIWDIYPAYATMTLFKKGDEPYWILYEGTPGGSFENELDFWVDSKGHIFKAKNFNSQESKANRWNEDLPDPEWVYFGDSNLNRVMYYLHHNSEDEIDCYWNRFDGGMTVFGFGRGRRDEGWQRLTDVPAQLTVGFAETSEYRQVASLVHSVYHAVSFAIGKPEKRKD